MEQLRWSRIRKVCIEFSNQSNCQSS